MQFLRRSIAHMMRSTNRKLLSMRNEFFQLPKGVSRPFLCIKRENSPSPLVDERMKFTNLNQQQK